MCSFHRCLPGVLRGLHEACLIGERLRPPIVLPQRQPQFSDPCRNPELGAAWQERSSETDRDYLSVKLENSSFPAPIYATLTEVEGEDGYQLIWSRPNRD